MKHTQQQPYSLILFNTRIIKISKPCKRITFSPVQTNEIVQCERQYRIVVVLTVLLKRICTFFPKKKVVIKSEPNTSARGYHFTYRKYAPIRFRIYTRRKSKTFTLSCSIRSSIFCNIEMLKIVWKDSGYSPLSICIIFF